MSKPEKLKPGMAQLLVEGTDAKKFCIWAYEAYKFKNIQVQDFGGIKEKKTQTEGAYAIGPVHGICSENCQGAWRGWIHCQTI